MARLHLIIGSASMFVVQGFSVLARGVPLFKHLRPRRCLSIYTAESSSRCWKIGGCYDTLLTTMQNESALFDRSCTVLLKPNVDLKFDEFDSTFQKADCSNYAVNDEPIYESELIAGNVNEISSRSGALFVGGRVALRRAASLLSQNSLLAAPILKSSSGAPMLPGSLVGSVSHKNDIIAASVAIPKFTNWQLGITYLGLGIDLEQTNNKNADSIGKRLLTDAEIDSLGCISGLPKHKDVMLRFSAKEAVYKAVSALVGGRYVQFKEVELFHAPTNSVSCGTMRVVSRLLCGTPFHATCDYVQVTFGNQEYWLTTVIGSNPLQLNG